MTACPLLAAQHLRDVAELQAADVAPVDRLDDVAVLHAGLLGRRAGDDRADRERRRLALDQDAEPDPPWSLVRLARKRPNASGDRKTVCCSPTLWVIMSEVAIATRVGSTLEPAAAKSARYWVTNACEVAGAIASQLGGGDAAGRPPLLGERPPRTLPGRLEQVARVERRKKRSWIEL